MSNHSKVYRFSLFTLNIFRGEGQDSHSQMTQSAQQWDEYCKLEIHHPAVSKGQRIRTLAVLAELTEYTEDDTQII